MPLPDYLQRALSGTAAPAPPQPSAGPTSGLPSYLRRALGEEQVDEPNEAAPVDAPPPSPKISPVLAGLTRPPGAPRTEDLPAEDAESWPEALGSAAVDTWQDIGDRLSRGSAQAVGALARTARAAGEGLEEVPLLGVLGTPVADLAGEIEQFKGREVAEASRDIEESPSRDSLAGDVVEAIPGMALTIGTGGAAAPAIGVPAATSLTLGLAGAQGFGGGMQQAEAAGATPEEALAYASLAGGAEVLTERFGDVRLLKRLLHGIPGNQITGILKDIALGGAEEGAAELAQSVARVMTYDDSEPAEALSGDVDTILRSSAVGAILQGMGSGVAASGHEVAPSPATEPAEPPPGIAELRDASLAIGGPVTDGPTSEEAMPHAGSDVSPEAINRVRRGERYVRISPGGEVTPIINDVGAVDVQVRPGEVKAVLAPDGSLRVEQGRANAAQQRALDALRQEGVVQDEIGGEAAEPDVYDLTDYGTEADAVDIPQELPPAPPPSLPIRLATRAGEEGFVQAGTLARDIGRAVKRNFKVGGLLPTQVFERKVIRDGRLAKHAERLRVLSTDLQRGIRRYKGSLSREQLVQYLDGAYRGMNLTTGPELLDPIQIKRIATRRGVSAQSVEQAMLRARESTPGGLLHAPEFIPLIREMRVETDSLTRQLRRQGLLTDGVARDLERSYGLYVNRQYEAIRNPHWQERIQERPLWNRAIELTTEKWNYNVTAKRYDEVARALGLRRGRGLTEQQFRDAVASRDPSSLADLAQARGKEAEYQEAMQEAEQAHPLKTPEQILGLLDAYITKTGGRPILPGGRPEGAIDLSATMERDILDELAREVLGEVRDVRSNLVTTATKLAMMVEQQDFLGDVAKIGKGDFLHEEPTRIEGVSYSQQIDPGLYLKAFETAGDPSQGPALELQVQRSKRRTDPLGGLYTSKDILDELNKIYETKQYEGFVKAYYGVSFAVKAAKTIGSPLQSANRNLLSNNFYALLNGVLPGDLKEFGRAAGHAYLRTAPWMPGSTNRARSQRVQRYLELGLFDQGTDVGELKRLEARSHIWRGEEQAMAPIRRLGETVEYLGKHYNAADNVAKAYVFEKLLPRYRKAFPGLPKEQIEEYLAERLRNTMQNYGYVPRGVQELAANPIVAPFPSFIEEVIRNTKNAAKLAIEEARDPNPQLAKIGRQRIAGMIAAAAIPSTAAFVGRYLLNMDDDDEEAARRFMAPWNRNGIVMFLPAPGEGKVRFFDWSFMDTFAKLKEPLLRAAHGDFDGAMESLEAPLSEELLLKVAMDVGRNTKAEGGKVFNEYAPMWYQASQAGAHAWKGLAPGLALNVQRIADPDRNTVDEVLALFGPRIVTLDIADRMTSKGFDYQEATLGARNIFRTAVNGRGPLEERDHAANVSKQQLTGIVEQMVRDVNAARTLDIPDSEIEASLERGRVPKWCINGLLDGAVNDIVQHYIETDAGYAEEKDGER